MYQVLIADDESIIREGIKCLFDWESLGYTIAGEAANGETAYQQILALQPDIVLLDIRMPGMSGLDVIREARAQGFTGKVIILSGYSDFKYAQEAIRYGVQYYLTKPIDEDELEEILRSIKENLDKAAATANTREHYREKARETIIRQIKMMKQMGCDAIRTAHNMPSTMQMEICDSLGMMVMAESFDMWIYPKCKNGYAKFFKEWSDKDITNLVKHHRNHPSIVMWSIGNEIPEQWSQEGVQIAKHLQDLCHQYDPSRPVTQGMDRAEDALKSGFAQTMDVPGFNYRVHKYYKNIEQLPQGFLLGSETASTVSSRGVYKFPVVVSDKATYPDGQCSSYDTEYCSWSNLPDDDWKMQDDYSWVIGEFVWTGYDYLGEPTPYDTYWPSRSSYFGICDLAGLPKDRYYMYRARWNEQQHTTHLLPHWNWKGREGEVTPVYCYTDGVEGELFVNGKSQGRVRKDKSSRLDRYRLRWNNVKYEPGEIRVVTYNQYGDKVGEDVKRTAGEPAQMKFSVETPDHEPIACMVEGCTDEHNVLLNADGNDLAFITVSLQDKDGNECPLADDELTFEVSGAGTFKAACNGDATSLEPFTQPQMKLFSGKLVVIVQSSKQKGDIILKVKDSKRNIEKSITLQAI